MKTPVRKIQPARDTDYAMLTAVLVSAFDDDPLAIWLYPDQLERRKNHAFFFSESLGESNHETLIDMTETNDAVAIWRHVDHPIKNAPPPGACAGAPEFFAKIAESSPQAPYWNLSLIGTGIRGAGLGGALLHHRLDRLSGPVALWTANEANLIFYEKFGFSVFSRIDGVGISAWWLMREEAVSQALRPP